MDRTMRKLLAVAWRWFVPVVALVLLSGVVASSIGDRIKPTFTAESVLIVPPKLPVPVVVPAAPVPGASATATPSPTVSAPSFGSPSDAAKLAQLYAAALPSSQSLISAVVSDFKVVPFGLKDADLTAGLTATVDQGTSLLRLDYTGSNQAEVLAVLNAANFYLTGATPPSPVLDGTLNVNSAPTVATASGTYSDAAPLVGGIVGLVLGLLLAWAVERADRRADQVGDLRAILPCPVTDWFRPSPALAITLVDRWTQAVPGGDVVLLGVGRTGDEQLGRVAAWLRSASPVRVRAASLRRSRHPESLASPHAVSVLVVRRGTRRAVVEDALQELAVLGVRPTWALLASGLAPQSPAAPSTPAAAEGELAGR